MGAAAISANAGSMLAQAEKAPAVLQAMGPFIHSVSLLVWAWGTWWIPLFVIFGVWKHVVRRLPMAHTSASWSIVFPIGMYAVTTNRLALADNFPPLQALASVVAWVGLAAWIGTTIGLVVMSWRSFDAPR